MASVVARTRWVAALESFSIAVYTNPLNVSPQVVSQVLSALSAESSQWMRTLQFIDSYCNDLSAKRWSEVPGLQSQVVDAEAVALLHSGRFALAERVCRQQQMGSRTPTQRIVRDICRVQLGHAAAVQERLVPYLLQPRYHRTVEQTLALHITLLRSLVFACIRSGSWREATEVFLAGKTVPALAGDRRFASLEWYCLAHSLKPALLRERLAATASSTTGTDLEKNESVALSYLLRGQWMNACRWAQTGDSQVSVGPAAVVRIAQVATDCGEWRVAASVLTTQQQLVYQQRIALAEAICTTPAASAVSTATLCQALAIAQRQPTRQPTTPRLLSPQALDAAMQRLRSTGGFSTRVELWGLALRTVAEQSLALAEAKTAFAPADYAKRLQLFRDTSAGVAVMLPGLSARSHLNRHLLEVLGADAIPMAHESRDVVRADTAEVAVPPSVPESDAGAVVALEQWEMALVAVAQKIASSPTSEWVREAVRSTVLCDAVGRWESVLRLFTQLYRKEWSETQLSSKAMLDIASAAVVRGNVWWAAASLLDAASLHRCYSQRSVDLLFRVLRRSGRWEETAQLYLLTRDRSDSPRQRSSILSILGRLPQWERAFLLAAPPQSAREDRQVPEWTSQYSAAVAERNPHDALKIFDWALKSLSESDRTAASNRRSASGRPPMSAARLLRELVKATARSGDVSSTAALIRSRLPQSFSPTDDADTRDEAVSQALREVFRACMHAPTEGPIPPTVTAELLAVVELAPSPLLAVTHPDVIRTAFVLARRRGVLGTVLELYQSALEKAQPSASLQSAIETATRVRVVLEALVGRNEALVEALLNPALCISSPLILEWTLHLAQQGLLLRESRTQQQLPDTEVSTPAVLPSNYSIVRFHVDYPVAPDCSLPDFVRRLHVPLSIVRFEGAASTVVRQHSMLEVSIPFFNPSSPSITADALIHVNAHTSFVVACKPMGLPVNSFVGNLRHVLRGISHIPSESVAPILQSYWESIGPVLDAEEGLVVFVPVSVIGTDYFRVSRSLRLILGREESTRKDLSGGLVAEDISADSGNSSDPLHSILRRSLSAGIIERYRMKALEYSPGNHRLLVDVTFPCARTDFVQHLMRDLALSDRDQGWRIIGGSKDSTVEWDRLGVFCYQLEVCHLPSGAFKTFRRPISELFTAMWTAVVDDGGVLV